LKRIIGILVIILIIVLSIGQFFIQDSMLLKYFSEKYDTAINIIIKPETVKESILYIQEKANKYNLDFIKNEHIPKESRHGKQEINTYIFLSNLIWFKESFPEIVFIEDSNTNKFKESIALNLLTRKNVRMLPYENIGKNAIVGDYHFKGTKGNIQKFLDELNSDGSLGIKASIVDFAITSDLSYKQVFLHHGVVFILIVALVFCLLIFNASLSKEMSVSVLFGHNKLNFSLRKTINLLGIPLIASLILANILLYLLSNPSSLKGFIISTRKINKDILMVCLSIVLMEFVMLFFKIKNIKIISLIKGYRVSFNKSSKIIKCFSVVALLYLLMASVLGLGEYLKLKPYLVTLENTKDYANIACSWPWAYEEDNEKFEEIVVPKLNALWNMLDEEGAILFYAPNIQKEGVPFDKEYVKRQIFSGEYAYINKNYLELAGLVDTKNRGLAEYSIGENEWLIFVPENVKIGEEERQEIRKRHSFSVNINEELVIDTYVPIKQGQIVYSFDSQKSFDNMEMLDYVLIAINGKKLIPNRDIKLPSLVNGKFHPYLSENSGQGYEYIKEIINITESDQFVLYISSAYEEVASRIEMYKLEAIVNCLGFLLSVLILITLLKIDKESYFYNHGQRIDVSRLFGYDFVSIHKKKIWENAFIYITSLALLFFIILLANQYGKLALFIPRNGWNVEKLVFVLVVSTTCILACFGVEMRQLKKYEKNIVIRLKEGV
jgi:putative ABC transport system permease protein